MSNKYHSDVSRPITIDRSYYAPSAKSTGDLEGATKTITRTAEASGVGNADYSYAGTIPAPSDARWNVLRISTKFTATIDSDDGTHDLRCRVYVDSQTANNLLYDLTFAATGAQVAVQDAAIGTKDTIFNLLKDGAAHTLYFFFWTPGNHAPVISQVTVVWCVGATNAASWGFEVISFTDNGGGGLVKVAGTVYRYSGSGSNGTSVMAPAGTAGDGLRMSQGISGCSMFLIVESWSLRVNDTSVATDQFYVPDISTHIMRW